MYLRVSVYDVGKQETVGDGEAYTYIVSCRNEDAEDTEDSHRRMSSVAVLFCPCRFPYLIWSSADLSIINCVVRTVCGV